MELLRLSRCIISSPHSPPTLRPAPAPRLGRRLPFGAFSPPQPLSNLVRVSVPFARPSYQKKKTVINQRLGSASSPAARARMLHQQGAAAAAAAGVGGGLGPEQRHARPRPAHPRRRRLTRCCPPQPCRLRNCRRSRRLQVCPHLQSHEIARCLAPANAPS